MKIQWKILKSIKKYPQDVSKTRKYFKDFHPPEHYAKLDENEIHKWG